MAKRKKTPKPALTPAGDSAPKSVAHPPARRPAVLGISVVLFVLWLVFLVVVAWRA